MPRIARAVVAGFPHHIVQRGNNRAAVFFNQEDRAVYLFLLKKYSEKWNTPVSCYCLMNNHVHLIANPSSEESLQKTMQGITLCYTQHINRKYGRTGRLWESRYHSSVVERGAHLWAVARYIEQNPVRAEIVGNCEDYPHSSAPDHFGLVQDAVLGENLFPDTQRDDFIEFVRSPIPAQQIEDIRRSARTGRPFGAELFVREIEARLGKRLAALPVGRPRKQRT